MAWHYGTLTLEPDNGNGALEDLPAEYWVNEDAGTARLDRFRIGNWDGLRSDAVAMLGEAYVRRQETMAAEEFEQQFEERQSFYSDMKFEDAR